MKYVEPRTLKPAIKETTTTDISCRLFEIHCVRDEGEFFLYFWTTIVAFPPYLLQLTRRADWVTLSKRPEVLRAWSVLQPVSYKVHPPQEYTGTDEGKPEKFLNPLCSIISLEAFGKLPCIGSFSSGLECAVVCVAVLDILHNPYWLIQPFAL